jgi:hypothetical protein
MAHPTRIMWIESKGDGIVGPARIGRVRFSKSGKSLYHGGKRFETLAGQGFKANYFDADSGEHYWISGCRKDGMDALYSTDVTVDEDVREEYWVGIRGLPERKHVSSFRARGKH